MNKQPIDPRITILLVDDDPALRNLTKTYLEQIISDLLVLEANDGNAALEILETESINCIVSDFDMPAMDGISFLKIVRDHDQDLPFILYTGKGSEEVASNAISAGVSDYMQKSAGQDHYELLAKRIRNHIETHRSKERIHQTYEALDAIDQGFSILGEDETFLHVNSAYASVFGYERGELIGERWTILYHTENIETVRDEAIDKAVSTGSWDGQTRQVRKDESEIILDHELQFTSGGLMVCTIDNPTSAVGTESAVHQRA